MTEERRPNAWAQCVQCWKRNYKGVPPMMYVMLVTGILCWVFGAMPVTALTLGAILVLVIMRHMSDVKEE